MAASHRPPGVGAALAALRWLAEGLAIYGQFFLPMPPVDAEDDGPDGPGGHGGPGRGRWPRDDGPDRGPDGTTGGGRSAGHPRPGGDRRRWAAVDAVGRRERWSDAAPAAQPNPRPVADRAAQANPRPVPGRRRAEDVSGVWQRSDLEAVR